MWVALDPNVLDKTSLMFILFRLSYQQVACQPPVFIQKARAKHSHRRGGTNPSELWRMWQRREWTHSFGLHRKIVMKETKREEWGGQSVEWAMRWQQISWATEGWRGHVAERRPFVWPANFSLLAAGLRRQGREGLLLRGEASHQKQCDPVRAPSSVGEHGCPGARGATECIPNGRFSRTERLTCQICISNWWKTDTAVTLWHASHFYHCAPFTDQLIDCWPTVYQLDSWQSNNWVNQLLTQSQDGDQRVLVVVFKQMKTIRSTRPLSGRVLQYILKHVLSLFIPQLIWLWLCLWL